MALPLQTRNSPGTDLLTRAASLSLADPASFDSESRSVEVVAATQNPAQVFDSERMEVVTEVLLMSGLSSPPARVPLLDTHSRHTTSNMLGSARDFRVEGEQCFARAHFSEVAAAQEALTLVREGHLTDVSIGYRVATYIWLEDGETQKIEGKSYTGPIKIATQWSIHELSTVPIGADEATKVRAANHSPKERPMDPKLIAYLVQRGLITQDASHEQARAALAGLAAGDLRSLYAQAEAETRSSLLTELAPEQITALIPRGDAPEPQPEGTRSAPAQPAGPAPVSDPPAGAGVASRAALDERQRISEIRGLGQTHGHDEADIARMINDSTTVENARLAILEAAVTRSQTATGGIGAHVLVDQSDKFRAAGIDSLLLRAGLAPESPDPGADELRGFSLVELARESLRIAGLPHGGLPRDMVARAFTTSDFPSLLADVANRSLFEGYDTAPESWQEWCGTGSVSDFKTYNFPRTGEFSDLEEVREAGEYKYGDMGEANESFHIGTYGKLFAISRQLIINDDLNALTSIPRKMGAAAARKVGDIAVAVITANSAMGDGIALFDAAHANVATASAPAVAALAEGIKLMKLQKDPGGKKVLNWRPEFFLAPVSLEGAAEQFFHTELIGGAENQPNLRNPYQGSYFSRIYEPRLDDFDENAWYLLAHKGLTVVVYFLDGNQKPYMEEKAGWNVDGVEYKIRIDAGAMAMDWRGSVANDGE